MNNLKGSLLLFLTALIWGTAFVAQSSAMDHIGPLLFVSVRFFIGGLVLIPLIIYFGNRSIKKGEITKNQHRKLLQASIKSGILCGIFLTIGTLFQQYGLIYTTAGKSAFITALYVVLVPVVGVFIGKKINKAIIVSVILAVTGFWLLCIQEDFSMSTGDILTAFCALGFTAQIMSIDWAMQQGTDPIVCSATQFFTVAVLSFVPMLIFEGFDGDLIVTAAPSILYTGIFSGGVAYTLQMVAQKYTDPTLATLIMSLESVFAAISGAIILHERLSFRDILGCVLVLLAVLMAQLLSLPKKDKGEA